MPFNNVFNVGIRKILIDKNYYGDYINSFYTWSVQEMTENYIPSTN